MKTFIVFLSVIALIFATCGLAEEIGDSRVAQNKMGNPIVSLFDAADAPTETETGGVDGSVEADTVDTVDQEEDVVDQGEFIWKWPQCELSITVADGITKIGPIPVFHEIPRHSHIIDFPESSLGTSIGGTRHSYEWIGAPYPQNRKISVFGSFLYSINGLPSSKLTEAFGKIGEVTEGEVYFSLPDLSDEILKEWDLSQYIKTDLLYGSVIDKTPGLEFVTIQTTGEVGGLVTGNIMGDTWREYDDAKGSIVMLMYSNMDGFVKYQRGQVIQLKKGYNFSLYSLVDGSRTVINLEELMKTELWFHMGRLRCWQYEKVNGEWMYVVKLLNPGYEKNEYGVWIYSGAEVPYIVDKNGFFVFDEAYYKYTSSDDPREFFDQFR